MQLNGAEAIARGCVQNHTPDGIKAASYDLRVGRVIVKGKEYSQPVAVAPQQMFIIVSEETVQVPPGHVGYAMPKTSLCNDGILTINTGILDPGYQGRISTTAINFDQTEYEISPGDPFLRIVFHELVGPDAATAAETYRAVSDPAYLRDRRQHSRNYPETFLNIPGQVEALTQRITKDVLDRQQATFIWLLTGLTVLFFLWNLGVWALMSRQTNTAVERLMEVERNQADIQSLRGDVDVMRELRLIRELLEGENRNSAAANDN